MSAVGQKPTYAPQKAMSALPRIATAKGHVCFTPESGLVRRNEQCPLRVMSGHSELDEWRGELNQRI